MISGVVRADAGDFDRLTPAERARLDEWRDQPSAMLETDRAREAERIADRRLWAVVTLRRISRWRGRSCWVGRYSEGNSTPRRCDGRFAVNRCPHSTVHPRPAGHLDAVAEGGPFRPKASGR